MSVLVEISDQNIGLTRKDLSRAKRAAFLILCDAFARTIIPPLEIPIGVITSVVGAPIFIALLKARQKLK